MTGWHHSFIAAALLLAGMPRLFAASYPPPGQSCATAVTLKQLDPATYQEWQGGEERTPEATDANRGPQWVIWTDNAKESTGRGLAFGLHKEAGPRHLRVGFTDALPVGTVLVRGNVSVSVLLPTAAYPGQLGDHAQWLAGQRLVPEGRSSAQSGRDNATLWIFPPGTTTRALRFTHVAEATDATYEGWLGACAVLPARVLNLAPYALPAALANDRLADKLINGNVDGWGAWDNASADSAALANRPLISREHPEWVQLTWPQPVRLDGLLAIWTGFGAADVLAYSGPRERHPRDATDADWTLVGSYAGLVSGYSAALWPNYLPFGKAVTTRAIRLRLTAAVPASHPHLTAKVAGGKRVWLGELLALQTLGAAELQAPTLAAPAAVPHAPIPVRFTLPSAGFVTLVLEDASGLRVRNLVAETWFPAGDNTAWWDGTDDLGRDVDAAEHGLYNLPARFVEPATYRARGLWRQAIVPHYEFPVYAPGTPPWSTADHTGAWLANHTPPSAALFVPARHSPTGEPSVFLGCAITEGPDGMAWVDLDGRKRGGMKWIGGNWTSAPFLGRDPAPDADPGVSAYVAAIGETDKQSGVYELRLTALLKGDGSLRADPVYKAPIAPAPAVTGAATAAADTSRAILGGVAAYHGLVAYTLTSHHEIRFVNAATHQPAGVSKVTDPRGLIYDAAGHLFVIAGTHVLRFDPPAQSATPVAVITQGLEAPVGLTLDAAGRLYVSDQGSSHQVKVFAPPPAATPAAAYTLVQTIGHAGAPQAGPYDRLHLNHPAGLAVDASGQLWVAENDFLPKRVSVWSPAGALVRAFYGPGKYGGGGILDAHDTHKFYYADEQRGTLEFTLDWQAGTAQLTTVLYRQTAASLPLPFRAAAPETALYRDHQRYFTNCYNSSPTSGHSTALLYIERGGVAQPAAAMGLANDWPLLKTADYLPLWPAGSDPKGDKNRNGGINQALFIWSDRNDDGRVQPAEVTLQHVPAGGVTVLDDLSFCVARVGEQAMRFAPTGFTPGGVPSYDFATGRVLATGVHGPASSGGNQVLADDSAEAILTLGVAPYSAYSVSGTRAGKAVWSYPNLWPGLHASHHAAKPDHPGELIGVTRLLGSLVRPQGSQVAPLWAVNGNMGDIYLFTRDGLFVATIFMDVRQGKLWKMAVAERNMSLDGITLHDENFWPSISQTPAGQVYLVDGANCSLVRLDGLDTLRPIPPGDVIVTPADLQASRQFVVAREDARQQAVGSGILHAALRTQAPTVDGKLDDWAGATWVEIDRRGAGANFNSTAKPYNIQGALAVAGDRLYAAWDTAEPKLLTNSGELAAAIFKTGGALDLMLGTDPAAAPERREAVAGDLRLLVTRVHGHTRAMLYQPVVPGAPAADKVPFSSPARTIVFDRVTDVSDQVQLADDGQGHFEIAVPLALLGLQVKPGLRLRGDLGILRGSANETTARSYWSNKATGITADVPSEVELTPSLWGTILCN